ncbi:MAG: hypothetical protein K2Q20_02030 [Phycisphaerales bacterium]|nr:hypothetical protein [Phycisphaerales bacterium]
MIQDVMRTGVDGAEGVGGGVGVRMPVPTNQADAEHLATQQTVTMLGSIALSIEEADLKTFVERVERMHTLGPLVDPTLYRRGMARLTPLAEVGRAVLALRGAMLKLEAAVKSGPG